MCVQISLYLDEVSLEAKTGKQMTLVAFEEMTAVANRNIALLFNTTYSPAQFIIMMPI